MGGETAEQATTSALCVLSNIDQFRYRLPGCMSRSLLLMSVFEQTDHPNCGSLN